MSRFVIITNLQLIAMFLHQTFVYWPAFTAGKKRPTNDYLATSIVV